MWRPIETYEKPATAWDFDQPKALFFSEETGPVVGCCVLRDDKECEFFYGPEILWMNPTHWMPLPPNP